MERLKQHSVTLHDQCIVLRPLAESDWDILLKWNSDSEVLYFAEGDDVAARSLEEVQAIYREVSRSAFCFMTEWNGAPIGECWLQQMNLERIMSRFPGLDCRRIDLMIGEKALWGQGIGTEVIRLLTQFGFERENADAIFGCDIADYNPRSLRAFQKVGYEVFAAHEQPSGAKARICYDLILTREKYSTTDRRECSPQHSRL